MFRYTIASLLLVFCLSGCNSTGNKSDLKDSSSGNSPFGFFQKKPDPKNDFSNNSAASNKNISSNAPTGNPSGILAGQVMDRNNRRPSGVIIQVVDLQKTNPDSKFDVVADSQGYFTIRGLQPGRNYQLVARVKDGEKFYTGTILATPPNPRVSIFVKEEVGAFPAAQDGQNKNDPSAPATIDKPKTAEATSENNNAPASTTSLPNADRIAKDGFASASFPGAILSIPPRTNEQGGFSIPVPPSLPQIGGVISINPSNNANQLGGYGANNFPSLASPVPACVLVGQKLENFALYDMNGQVWDYKKNKSGRMVLLDFWFSSCGPCLQAIPHIVELQRRYKTYGLEVVGIAYEKGTPEEQVNKVRPIRARYHMNYNSLFGGSGPEPCPVRTQFDVTSFPTLVLLDEEGNIVWRNQKDEGVDPRQLKELEIEIRKGLGIPSK